MTNKNFKSAMKKSLASACVAAACAMASTPASAVYYPDGSLGDPKAAERFELWDRTIYKVFVQEVTNQFYAINTYLAQIYAYLRDGEGDTGKGVIGTMNKIWTEQRPYMESMSSQQSAWNRRNMLDGVVAQTIANKLPDPRSCSEIAAVHGARASGGGGGGGGGGGVSRGTTEAKVAKEAGGGKPSELAHANTVYVDHKGKGYCASEDATYAGTNNSREAFGCTAADIRKMPDADARVQSIFRPAHDFTNPQAVKQYGSSLTFNNGKSTPLPIGDQAVAADDAAANIVARFSPPYLPKEVEQTEGGRMLLTKVKVFNARISPAIYALAQTSARLTATKTNLPAAALAAMKADFNITFRNLHPDSEVPETLSEAEVMRHEVMSRYADTLSTWNTSLKAATPDMVGKIQAQNQAVELYLLYNIHERQQEGNAILAAILAQAVNPVTKAELERGAQATQRR